MVARVRTRLVPLLCALAAACASARARAPASAGAKLIAVDAWLPPYDAENALVHVDGESGKRSAVVSPFAVWDTNAAAYDPSSDTVYFMTRVEAGEEALTIIGYDAQSGSERHRVALQDDTLSSFYALNWDDHAKSFVCIFFPTNMAYVAKVDPATGEIEKVGTLPYFPIFDLAESSYHDGADSGVLYQLVDGGGANELYHTLLSTVVRGKGAGKTTKLTTQLDVDSFLLSPVYDPAQNALLGFTDFNFTLAALDVTTGEYRSYGEPIVVDGVAGGAAASSEAAHLPRSGKPRGAPQLPRGVQLGDTDVALWHAAFDGETVFTTVNYNVMTPPCNEGYDDLIDDFAGYCSSAYFVSVDAASGDIVTGANRSIPLPAPLMYMHVKGIL